MSKEKVIQANTFTCGYIESEDRLLLSINYTDIINRVDFWITRNFLLKLLPHFFDYTIALDSLDIQSFSNVETDRESYEFNMKEPILLESVDITRGKTGFRIIFKNLKNNIFCIALFDQEHFDRFVNLVINASPKMQWGIYNVL